MNNKEYIKAEWWMSESSPQDLPESETDVLTEDGRTLILYNDDFNTFDHVINCLVNICNHDLIQAEQCAYIVHYNGKCDVLHGDDSKLDKCCSQLKIRGLSAVVE